MGADTPDVGIVKTKEAVRKAVGLPWCRLWWSLPPPLGALANAKLAVLLVNLLGEHHGQPPNFILGGQCEFVK